MALASGMALVRATGKVPDVLSAIRNLITEVLVNRLIGHQVRNGDKGDAGSRSKETPNNMARPGGLELPTFWFVANHGRSLKKSSNLFVWLHLRALCPSSSSCTQCCTQKFNADQERGILRPFARSH